MLPWFTAKFCGLPPNKIPNGSVKVHNAGIRFGMECPGSTIGTESLPSGGDGMSTVVVTKIFDYEHFIDSQVMVYVYEVIITVPDDQSQLMAAVLTFTQDIRPRDILIDGLVI